MGTIHEDLCTFMKKSCWILEVMRNISDTFIERIRYHTFYVQKLFFFENRAVYEDNDEKYCRAGQATDDNMAHAHCTVDTQGCKHTLTICNVYYYSTTTTVARTQLHVVTRTLPVLLQQALSAHKYPKSSLVLNSVSVSVSMRTPHRPNSVSAFYI